MFCWSRGTDCRQTCPSWRPDGGEDQDEEEEEEGGGDKDGPHTPGAVAGAAEVKVGDGDGFSEDHKYEPGSAELNERTQMRSDCAAPLASESLCAWAAEDEEKE